MGATQPDADLSALSKEQREQVMHQWRSHGHNRTRHVNIPLSGHDPGDYVELAVHPGVWNPALTSARYHASNLFYNNTRLYTGKRALDMGCGTGIAGIVMAMCGAERVVMSDASSLAVVNAKENIGGINDNEQIIDVVQGDLFENVNDKFDCIVFHQPFFEGSAQDTIGKSMLNSGELIERFLEQAPRYLRCGGTIVMPSYDLAGPMNNPQTRGLQFGYRVATTWQSLVNTGVQKGWHAIHELRRE